ncbi:hypothetical protein LLH03_05935 [bacterium]|nr:hypothetical protein [bacterium]
MLPDSGLLVRANLHTHSHASAGSLAPFDHNHSPDASQLVKSGAQYHLGCLAITDHAETVTQQEWDANATAADSAPDGLVVLRGFEWTHVTGLWEGDHVNVFGTIDQVKSTKAENQAACGETLGDLHLLYNWLASAGSLYDAPVVAQFNHVAFAGPHFDHFAPPPSEAVRDVLTLAELAITRPFTASDGARAMTWNSFPVFVQRGEPRWRQALANGWRLSPTLNADNDGVLEPSARRYHTGIFLKPGSSPSRKAILEALAARRTFASQDGDAEIQLWYGQDFMGSTDVRVAPGSSFRLMYRHPESHADHPDLDMGRSVSVLQGQEHPLPDAQREGDFWVWDIAAPAQPGEYYLYARLRQPSQLHPLWGDYLFSAPIWFRV